MPGGPDKKKIEEIRLRNRKGDPRTIKTPPGGPPKSPKPKPKPKKPGSNMQSYDPMGAGLRTITIRKNDFLDHIADRVGTTSTTIKKLNPKIINDVNKIFAGAKIKVPVNKGGRKK